MILVLGKPWTEESQADSSNDSQGDQAAEAPGLGLGKCGFESFGVWGCRVLRFRLQDWIQSLG